MGWTERVWDAFATTIKLAEMGFTATVIHLNDPSKLARYLFRDGG